MAAELVSNFKSIRSEIAILLGAAIIAGAIICAAAQLKPSYVPNPAGGLWIEKSGALYLCRMNNDKSATCLSALSGKTVAYSELVNK